MENTQEIGANFSIVSGNPQSVMVSEYQVLLINRESSTIRLQNIIFINTHKRLDLLHAILKN